MSEENKFQNVLKSLRTIRGKEWTQKKTAKLLDVALRLYVGWENGESIPSADNLKKIVAEFELDAEEEAVLYRAAAQVPPRIHNLPFPPNPFFTGRTTHLERLGQLFTENGSVALTQPVSISGLGGVGKTQLALAYAHRCYQQKIYRAVFWIDAASKTTIEAGYLALAQLFGLPEQHERKVDNVVQASKQWLERHTDWLLIMDNADDLQLARSFFPVEHQGHILLTTRSQIVGNVASQVGIEEMESTEAVLFLLRRVGMVQEKAASGTVTESVRETTRQLAELLGRHPLALDQAGAYIEETGVTFAEYIELYQNERRFLLERRGSLENDYSEHPEAAAATFELCFQKASESNPLATDILRFCAFLQPDAIPEELFHADGSFARSAVSFNEDITTLRRYSLVTRNAQEKAFTIHRLVQAVLADGLSPGLQTQWRQRALQAVRVLFPVGRIKITEWERCDRLLPHILACVSWPQDELILSAGTARLFHEAVIYLSMRGRYTEAEPLVQLVLLMYKHHYGADHPVTASALEALSGIYSEQQNDEAAYLLTEQALAIREKHLGADHPQTAWSILSLASTCLKQGHYKKSEELLIQAISILEKHAATEYISLAAGLCQLAHIYLLFRKDEQAGALLQRAVSIFEEHPEADDLDTDLPLYGLLILMRDQGRQDEAVGLYQRIISLRERQLEAV